MHCFWAFFLVTFFSCVFAFDREERYATPTEIIESDSLPWVVKMTGTVSYFTGILVSDRYILTSAHALDSFPYADCLKAHFKNSIIPFSVKARRYILHPKFNFPENDFAIVELDQAIPINMKGIEVPVIDNTTYLLNDLYRIKPVYSAGYANSDTLKKVSLVWSSVLNGDYELRYAGTAEKGDSGGPLFYYSNGTAYLLGVQSRAQIVDSGAIYYAAMSRNLEFITNNIDLEKYNNDIDAKDNWTDIICIFDISVGVGVGVGITLGVIAIIFYAYKKLKKPA